MITRAPRIARSAPAAPVAAAVREPGHELDRGTARALAPALSGDFRRVPVGPGLPLGAPGDAFEREADEASAAVRRGPALNGGRSDNAAVDDGGSGQESVDRARIHTGPRAAAAAAALGARALTVGRDIVFGAGQYAPQTAAGRGLLAHELTHVAQQEGTPRAIQRQQVPSRVTTPEPLYPTGTERASIQEIVNPQQQQAAATGQATPAVTDPAGFRTDMLARIDPYISAVVADAQTRAASSVSLSAAAVANLADIAQPNVETFYGGYLRAAVHTPAETARRRDFKLRDHTHLAGIVPDAHTPAIMDAWVSSRMEQQGGELLSAYNVLTGRPGRDQALFNSVRDAIVAARGADIQTIILFHPGREVDGETFIQPRVAPESATEPVARTERRGRWNALKTTVHEMLHGVTHERFQETVAPLERSRLAVEGFTEYFTRPVFRNVAARAAGDDSLRTSIEGVAAPFESSMVPPVDGGSYQNYVDGVEQIRAILGESDEGLKRAYFAGQVEYLGLGGWSEAEAARRRYPGNVLGFGALLTFNGPALLRVDYRRVVLGRGADLQFQLGPQITYLSEGNRLGVAGVGTLRYQGTNAYIEGSVGVGGSASATGPFPGSARLDLIPGMEAGVRMGAFRVGVNGLLLVPLAGGHVSDRVVRLGVGIGVGLDL